MIQVTLSLRARLMLWLLAGSTALAAILLIDAYLSARGDAERAYDAQLVAAAATLSDAIRWTGDRPVVTVPAATLRILSGATDERVYYGVFDASGRALTANLDLPVKPATRLPARRDITYNGMRWRLYGQRVDLAGWSAHTTLSIWVGQTTTGRRALAATLFEPAVVRFVILILAAGGLGLVAIASALAPVRRLRERLAQRAADDFAPLDARVPGEIAPLASTLDGLFARQRAARETLLRFTADASHQLKTPLAGLANASEAALESDDPAAWRAALVRIHATAQHSGRLAGQLLQMARLGQNERLIETTVDMAALAADVTRECVNSQDTETHDIGFVRATSGVAPVAGARWALAEALTNLIDNARVHTPPGTAITVTVTARDDRIVVDVDDDGPGLGAQTPDDLKAAFHRGAGANVPGSGLGLAIVDSIAIAHAGTLSIQNRPGGGCQARLVLPRAAAVS